MYCNSGEISIFYIAALFLLLYKLHRTRSNSSVSFKTQQLFLAAFAIRYYSQSCYFPHGSFSAPRQAMVDCYEGPFNLWDFRLCSSSYVVGLMLRWSLQTRSTRTRTPTIEDTFPDTYLIGISAVITIIVINNLRFTEYHVAVQASLWVLSYILESVAVIPQLYMVWRAGPGGTEASVVYYLCALSVHRIPWFVCELYALYMEGMLLFQLASVVALMVQVALVGSLFVYLCASAYSRSRAGAFGLIESSLETGAR